MDVEKKLGCEPKLVKNEDILDFEFYLKMMELSFAQIH